MVTNPPPATCGTVTCPRAPWATPWVRWVQRPWAPWCLGHRSRCWACITWCSTSTLSWSWPTSSAPRCSPWGWSWLRPRRRYTSCQPSCMGGEVRGGGNIQYFFPNHTLVEALYNAPLYNGHTKNPRSVTFFNSVNKTPLLRTLLTTSASYGHFFWSRLKKIPLLRIKSTHFREKT